MIGEEQKSRDLECLTANHIVVSPWVPNDHHLRKTLNIHAPVHQPLVNNTQLQDVSFRCCCSGRPCWCKVCYIIRHNMLNFQVICGNSKSGELQHEYSNSDPKLCQSIQSWILDIVCNNPCPSLPQSKSFLTAHLTNNPAETMPL